MRIHSTIDPCKVETADFSSKKLTLYYIIGREEDIYRMPKFTAQPNCNMTIVSYEFEQSWEDNSLLEYD